jgi:hypothetical protein
MYGIRGLLRYFHRLLLKSRRPITILVKQVCRCPILFNYQLLEMQSEVPTVCTVYTDVEVTIVNHNCKRALYLLRRRGGGVPLEITNCKHALYLVRRRGGGVALELHL